MKKLFIKFLFAFLGIFFISISSYGQNTPSLWKHTCNCGVAQMIVLDDNQNTYVVTDASAGLPHVIKLSPSGQTKFDQTYLPSGYTQMFFTNSFYKNGFVYVAGYVDSFPVTNRMVLTKLDTSGVLMNQVIIDSVAANTISGIKSQPYYNYGFYLDQQNNIHVGFIKSGQNFVSIYSFLKLDLNFNLINHFEQTLTFSSSPGPFYVAKDGDVFYSYSGSFNKLDSSYTAISWSYPINNYGKAVMISEDASGNPVFINNEPSPPVSSLIKLSDNGSNYSFNYESILNSGTETMSTLLLDTISDFAFTASYDNTNWPYKRSVYKNILSTGSSVWKDSVYDSQRIYDLQLDNFNNLVAAGGGTNYYVLFYNPAGIVTNFIVYDGPCGGNDAIEALRFTTDNKIIVGGSACESSSNINYGTTLKYANPNSATELVEISSTDFGLNPYPVPANQKLYLGERIYPSKVEFTDVQGRKVLLSVNDDQSVNVSVLPDGLYVLKIIEGKNIALTKVLISH